MIFPVSGLMMTIALLFRVFDHRIRSKALSGRTWATDRNAM